MKLGTSIESEAILYRVQIEGRGGDSVDDEYFETRESAILASAIDGQNRTPTQEVVLKLSDGTYIYYPRYVHVSTPPTEEQIAELKKKLTPAQKILFEKK